ncbi:ABC transporter ATP-binding protein [Granulicella sp. L60]|uniref:ABC transporter ATP-binding protein n=1 Tax=Granulicella sp. L60 TaxID=1641866 RepID=UPI00131D35A3|nr:ABC transporter ATP-binding protein [Granulicella sp. L60]
MLRLIRELIRPYRGTLIVILFAMLVESLMGLAAPWPVKVILDNVVANHHLPKFLDKLLASHAALSLGHGKLEIAALAGVAVVLIAVIGSFASYIDNYFTESVGQRVAHDLRMRTYEHLQRLSLSYYDVHRTGALLSTITSDIQTIESFASSSTLGIVVDLVTIIEMLGLMFWLNWDFALIAMGITPFLLYFMSRFRGAVKTATRSVRLRQADIVTVVQEGLESVRVVKAFGQENLEQEKLGQVSLATVNAALKARQVKALLAPIVNVTVALCTAVVLWRGASLILRGTMTAGALVVFLAYLTKFFKPLQDLAKMTNTMAQAAVGVERVQAILDADMIIPEHSEAQEPLPIRGEIVFEHVAFGYDKEDLILRDVNFRIEPGQLIGIVGPTGGGKSTVVSLIARFYDPTSGAVTLDGVDIRRYKLRSLRDQIGFVLQDTVLFQGTIRENIAYGRPHATQQEIEDAAKMANANEFIERMPNGYETLVGERGLALSGGQRQRIGIARAIVRNSPILILDEPTAALDTESERLVIEALERLMKGRTVITIAHRLSTIRDADSIIVLKGGVVAEQGTHQELLNRKGIYSDLYMIQLAPAAGISTRTDPVITNLNKAEAALY